MDIARVWYVWRTDSWLLLCARRQRCLWCLSSPNDLHQAGSKMYSGQSSSSFRVPAHLRILGEALYNRATLLKREPLNIPIEDLLAYVPPHFAGNSHTLSDFHSCPVRSIIRFPLCGRWHARYFYPYNSCRLVQAGYFISWALVEMLDCERSANQCGNTLRYRWCPFDAQSHLTYYLPGFSFDDQK